MLSIIRGEELTGVSNPFSASVTIIKSVRVRAIITLRTSLIKYRLCSKSLKDAPLGNKLTACSTVGSFTGIALNSLGDFGRGAGGLLGQACP